MKIYLARQEEKPTDSKEIKDLVSEKEILLQILGFRDDKDAKKFVEDMLKDIERERKWAPQQISKD